MSGIIGTKLGMTNIFNEEGKSLPCTIIESGPCVVTHVKSSDKDGYDAVQLGYGERKEKRTSAAMGGHFKKAGTTPKQKLVEFDGFPEDTKLGDEIKVDIFSEGEFVDIVGVSKGKGFQGVVKRHGFHGVGDATHGQHNRMRAPGSIGAASYPARVFKGMRMAGRMGGDRVKMLNLRVLKVDTEKNLIVVKGSIPGPKGSYVMIHK